MTVAKLDVIVVWFSSAADRCVVNNIHILKIEYVCVVSFAQHVNQMKESIFVSRL